MVSWDCEGSSYSDARPTGTGWDRLSLVFGPKLRLPFKSKFLSLISFPFYCIFLFTLSSTVFLYHFCSVIHSVTVSSPILFFFFFTFKIFEMVWNASSIPVRSQAEILQVVKKKRNRWHFHPWLTVTKVAFQHTKIFLCLGCFRSRERSLSFCDFISDSTWNNLSDTAPILSFQKVNQPYWFTIDRLLLLWKTLLLPPSFLPTNLNDLIINVMKYYY